MSDQDGLGGVVQRDAPPVEPTPSPWSYGIDRASDGKTLRITIWTVTGAAVVFCPLEFAETFGRDLLQQATGIQVASVLPNSRFTPKLVG